MNRNDQLDNGYEGQLTFDELLQPPQKLFAVSRIFARARKEMTLAEQKTFVYVLTELRFTQPAETDVVYLDKKVLAQILNINVSDTDNLSINLYRQIKDLPKHSYVEIDEKDLELQSSGFMITAITRFKNMIRLRFNKEYLPLFTGLSTNYITMWSADIFRLTSTRTVQFYEYLRQVTDTRETINNVGLGIKALKEMFGIPKDGKGSYMGSDGHFNRTNFEKQVIQPLCDDLSKTRMITLLLQPDGKYYEKVKAGNRVQGYRFFWTFSAYPAVASASEVKELQDKVDSNPVILKVAKDIVAGSDQDRKQSRQQSKPTNNKFNNFTQRDYDFAELEKALAQSQLNKK